jgi:hypothetical protein
MCLGGTSNFRKRWDEKRAHSGGVVDGFLSWDSLGGVEVPGAGDVFPLLSAVAPPKGEGGSLGTGDWGLGIGLDWIGLANGIGLAAVGTARNKNKNYREQSMMEEE